MIEFQQFVERNPWASLLVAGGLWFGVQAILSFIVSPYRERLRIDIAAAKELSELNRQENEFLDHLWTTSFAARSAVILSVVYVLALLMPRDAVFRESRQIESEAPTLSNLSEMSRMIDYHFLSVVAANPLFGILCIILRWSWRLKIVWLKPSVADSSHYVAMPLVEATCHA